MPNSWWNEEASEPTIKIETPDGFAIGSAYRREVDIPAGESTYVNSRGEIAGGLTGLTTSEAEFLALKNRLDRF